jgi:glucosamine kinase
VKLFAGIDGGQSHTLALVGDERGRILGRGLAGPADEVGAGSDSTRLRDALQGALGAALAGASLSPDCALEAVVAGVSGYEGRVYGTPPSFNAAKTKLLHDAPVAWAAALGGEPGVVAIAGTGSVAYAMASNGASVTVGGWGYLFGDEGSAFWIATEALRFALSFEDAGHEDALSAAARVAFSQSGLRALARAFYAGEVNRSEIASFAPRVIAFAREKHGAANGIVRGAAAAVVGNAVLCATRLRLERPNVAFVGGLIADEFFSQTIDAALSERAPTLNRVVPRYEPAAGALLLAYREAGLDIRSLDFARDDRA